MIFYVIFFSQILFISYVIPKKMITLMNEFMLKYPFESYPKLYNDSIENQQASLNKYKTLNHIMFVLGVILLVCLMIWNIQEQKPISVFVPIIYFLLQIIPEMRLQFESSNSLKNIRLKTTQSIKKAVIKPRKLFDFMSPLLFVFASAMCILSAVLIYIHHGLHIKGILGFLILLIYNGYSFLAIYTSIYGKKLYPYENDEDRKNRIKQTVIKQLVLSLMVSFSISGFIFSKIYMIESLKPSFISLCLQLMMACTTWLALIKMNGNEYDLSAYQSE